MLKSKSVIFHISKYKIILNVFHFPDQLLQYKYLNQVKLLAKVLHIVKLYKFLAIYALNCPTIEILKVESSTFKTHYVIFI